MGKIQVQHSYWRFQIGNFEFTSVLDTVDPLRFDFIFPDIALSEVSSELERRHIPRESEFNISCLVVNYGRQIFLVDTGLGANLGSPGLLLESLRGAGIDAGNVEKVILSHGHLDHIGGNFTEQGNNFPNARYVISRKEWEFWASEPDLTGLSDTIKRELKMCVEKNLKPLSGRLDLLDPGMDIAPGIQYFETPGHTPGQIGLAIGSGADRLIYLADVFHNLLQLNKPEWNTAFDLDRIQTIATRKAVLKMAASSGFWVFSSHFPFPAVGRIVEESGDYFWRPMG